MTKDNEFNTTKETTDDKPDTLTKGDLNKALKDQIDQGLQVEVKDGSFTLNYNGRQDSGTLDQPIGAVVFAAKTLIGPREPEQRSAE